MDSIAAREIIVNFCPFDRLKAKSLDRLIELGLIQEYKNGDTVYRQSDAPDYFYLLLQGRLVAKTQNGAGTNEIELIKRGTPFGIISIFTGQAHSVTIQAIEDSFVFQVEQERFKKFLSRQSVLAMGLSRILSTRIKARVKPKKIFQSKRIGVLGYSNCGKTLYSLDLARKLKETTAKNVIYIEIRSRDDFSLKNLLTAAAAPMDLSDFSEDNLPAHIAHEDIDYLLLKATKSSRFFPILNSLSEEYHFIICELSCHLLDKAFIDFICRADYIHFLLRARRAEIRKAARIIDELKPRISSWQDKIKVIISEFGPGDNLSYAQKRSLIAHPIYANIPDKSSLDYLRVIRRIARELGECVMGLALGSGGSYGFAHIGVLQVLEENNIPIDVICGSSMGSLVAAMWAAGFSVERMAKTAREFGKKLNLFSFPGFYFPFKGIVRAKRTQRIYRDIFGDITFYDLKHTLKLAAFNFFTRQAQVLEAGPLYKAVAASCSIPGVFEPVAYRDELLLDGGILNPLPVKILLRYGVNKIIAVNVTPSRKAVAVRRKPSGNWNVFDFIFGSIETMQRQFIREATRLADVVIHPVFDKTDWAQFERIDEFIETGRRRAQEKLEDIRRLLRE